MLGRCVLWLWLSVLCVRAWDVQPDGYEVIDGPYPNEDVDAWYAQWKTWKEMELRTVRYDPKDKCNVYNMEEAQWTQRNFVQAFLMLHDRLIFDRESQKYTPDKYVNAMESRLGRLDSVLLWPAYPNIGIDNRNQWDLLRTLPGGLEALRALVDDFHQRGIRVIIPYNPWDTATRDETGLEDTVRMYLADVITLEKLTEALGVDGFNGDTMYGVPKSFYNCSRPLVATPEGGVPSAYLSHNPASWGYYFGFANFPPVARAKFLEPRHMVQICARWSLDRFVDLQTAFFNGVGYVVWENVWGIWNAMTERESEATKRAFHVLRAFNAFTTSSEWRPYAYRSVKDQVFASVFPHPTSQHQWLFTIINAADDTRTLELPLPSDTPNATVFRVFDVFRGRELGSFTPGACVELMLEPRGFGAVLVASPETPLDKVLSNFTSFMEERQLMTTKPLSDYSNTRKLLRQTMTRGNHVESDNTDGMVRITGAESWWFNVSGVQIEPVAAWTPTWPQFGTGVQFPWEDRPWNNHSVHLTIRDFYIDQSPVTNAQFYAFLQASQYKTNNLERFLEHWENRRDATSNAWKPVTEWTIPRDQDKSPVVYVSFEDARAYAAFYQKRLPHDWEWQYVASNGQKYDEFPWGGTTYDTTKLPTVHRGKNPPLPEPVGSHPASQSLVGGVQDLIGHVWQMTDQFCDAHTCGLLLRGGSFYEPVASTLADPNWYFPQALRATQHNRFLMLSEDYDRSAFVGFRCARSASEPSSKA
ncbi:hypothetical protein Poli38472_010643 [Pythium oligandrum]|uniref:Sulfatase-modifying factor enzyme-like domain-containing protein n=1 Tax=Pythium oligandrum TaxID=41045 RepID=A0A8K1C3D4_PYTOL|nr:hypothetical protein Poli38472_010643 [Pythium oligandrum]|eukprot:TMW55761.1 hypothetical protein Poli38472_010643 [Pythium oligandrum]